MSEDDSAQIYQETEDGLNHVQYYPHAPTVKTSVRNGLKARHDTVLPGQNNATPRTHAAHRPKDQALIDPGRSMHVPLPLSRPLQALQSQWISYTETYDGPAHLRMAAALLAHNSNPASTYFAKDWESIAKSILVLDDSRMKQELNKIACNILMELRFEDVALLAIENRSQNVLKFITALETLRESITNTVLANEKLEERLEHNSQDLNHLALWLIEDVHPMTQTDILEHLRSITDPLQQLLAQNPSPQVLQHLLRYRAEFMYRMQSEWKEGNFFTSRSSFGNDLADPQALAITQTDKDCKLLAQLHIARKQEALYKSWNQLRFNVKIYAATQDDEWLSQLSKFAMKLDSLGNDQSLNAVISGLKAAGVNPLVALRKEHQVSQIRLPCVQRAGNDVKAMKRFRAEIQGYLDQRQKEMDLNRKTASTRRVLKRAWVSEWMKYVPVLSGCLGIR